MGSLVYNFIKAYVVNHTLCYSPALPEDSRAKGNRAMDLMTRWTHDRSEYKSTHLGLHGNLTTDDRDKEIKTFWEFVFFLNLMWRIVMRI